MVSFNNRVKQFIFCCFCKMFKKKYEDVIYIVECSVLIRITFVFLQTIADKNESLHECERILRFGFGVLKVPEPAFITQDKAHFDFFILMFIRSTIYMTVLFFNFCTKNSSLWQHLCTFNFLKHTISFIHKTLFKCSRVFPYISMTYWKSLTYRKILLRTSEYLYTIFYLNQNP